MARKGPLRRSLIERHGVIFASSLNNQVRPYVFDRRNFARGWHKIVIFRWPGDHNLVTGSRDDGGMRKVSQEDLDALNYLVQDGLIEVVSIDEFGEPSYRLASEFTAERVARTGESPGVRGSARCPKPSSAGGLLHTGEQGTPSVGRGGSIADTVKGSLRSPSAPLTVSAAS
jgi:hypothetical protein